MLAKYRRALSLSLAGAVALLACAGAGSAQDYPSATVRMVVPFPAGGAVDLIARLLANKLREEWGQSVIVENQPGANGNVGAEHVARSVPDGHTLLLSSAGVFATNKLLYKTLNYDPDKDLSPISLAVVAPNVLVANPGLQATSVQALIAQARANPGGLHYASQGNGSTGHLTGVALRQAAGIDIAHVPYRGAAPALNDVIAGHVPIMWDTITSVLPHIRAGKLRPLAVGSRERSPALPDVPTAIESGLSDFQSLGWFAVAVTAGTPEPVVRKIAAAVARGIKAPDVSKTLGEMGAQAVGGSPAELAAFTRTEIARWKTIIDAAGIGPE
jgi:tripartite-type tricarboxylate transporter receptor subunit TctC